ncbi:MAG: fused MFS/spermidine synthase [Halioglobus sp.]|jgi:spermidine synthase|nr:fused MFS/spermidine synthase [Halioglobus sp.]
MSADWGRQTVHTSRDDYGPILVINEGAQRILNFDSQFEQSCMQVSHPCQLVYKYTRFMALATAFVDPAHISLFGLGGGSLLRTLHSVLPECTFEVVELRQAVIDVADEFFLLPGDHRVRITAGDAFDYVRRMDSASSDIIFSDMFDAHCVAPGQLHGDFLRQCARVLGPRGFLVINLHALPKDRRAFFAMLGEIFPAIALSETVENTILYASRVDPARVEINYQRIEDLETQLRQRLMHLLARVKPVEPGGRG